MAGRNDADGAAEPPGMAWNLLAAVPRWAYAIFVLAAAIALLWALLGKPILQAAVTGLAVGS
ncbi:MAG TPA: hypothetical protein VEO20_03330, partial [Thermoplasmata archaeon]|nr:hypothetical protein [Thermoplasmata archaeon]